MLDRLAAALGLLILRRGDDLGFRIEGEVPFWYRRMFPAGERGGDPIDVVDRFAFLESFLPTAASYWGSRGSGRVRSGYWVQSYPSGEDVPLQASALHVDGAEYLVVEYTKSVYERDTGYLQKARERALGEQTRDARAEAVHAGDRRYRLLLDFLPVTVLRLAEDGRIVEGPGFAGNTLAGLFPEDLERDLVERVREANREKQPQPVCCATASGVVEGWLVPLGGGECWAILSER